MRFSETRPYVDPDVAARKLVEIAKMIEPVQDGRIFIELINWPMLTTRQATPAEYKAGLDWAIARDWLVLHERCTYVKFTHRVLVRRNSGSDHRL